MKEKKKKKSCSFLYQHVRATGSFPVVDNKKRTKKYPQRATCKPRSNSGVFSGRPFLGKSRHISIGFKKEKSCEDQKKKGKGIITIEKRAF